MLIEETVKRQKQLEKYLYELASVCMSENDIKRMAISFKGLYTDGFRHNYSSFFPIITKIGKQEQAYNLEFLGYNLVELRMLVERDFVNGEKEFQGLYKPLTKLSDHISLEISRYNYYSQHEQKVSDLEIRNAKLQKELKDAREELDDAKDRVSSVQAELISVLSIFAAIVFTFSGGTTLLGSAFANMTIGNGLKNAFFVLLCGFVLCNIVFLMMYIVGKITGRSIYARCKTKDCSCGKSGEPECNGINRMRKRLPYVFWLNVIFILFMIIDVVIWYLDKIHNFIP